MRSPVPVIFAVLLLHAAPALACLTLETFELVGYPSPDQVDVPVDAVLSFAWRANQTALPTERVALRTRDGEPVPVSTRRSFDHLEIVPSAPLAPDTSYELSVVWRPATGETDTGARGQLSFRTGAGPWRGEVPAPKATIKHWAISQQDSCGPWERGSCISLSDDDALYLVDRQFRKGSFIYNLYGYGQGHDLECLTIRRRAPTGQLSEPSQICRSDGNIYDLRPDTAGEERSDLACTQRGLTLRGKPVRHYAVGEATSSSHDPLDGCSLAPGGARTGNAGWALLLGAALTWRRRRVPDASATTR